MKLIELGKGVNIKGKAGNLNTLYNEFNIARGFIIPNEVFFDFLSINNISLDSDFSKIRKEIMDGVFPDEKELKNFFINNKYEEVIVRSSAFLEDGNSFSFAGQFESFTHTNIDLLIVNIKKCWISQFEDNVKVYLNENNIGFNYQFDVLVQEMIVSDISGVAFSINPTNGSDEILIEVTDAQCEELVSGSVIPHRYSVGNKISGDDFISKEKLILITESINKLKKIFKRDVEIEFCFKNDLFYLFQVRAITKVYFSLINHIKNELWCSFKNDNWNLFNRSLWILGATKYKNKRINNEVTEDITLYYPYNQKQIRGFNENQPPLDEITIKSHNSYDIDNYIFEFYGISEDIKKISCFILKCIEDNDFATFNVELKKLIKKNAILNSYEYLIGSLGNALYETLDPNTIKNIEKWRNNESNSYFPIYNNIFDYVSSCFNFNINRGIFMMYIHVNEFIALCDKKIKPETIINRIKKREKFGLVLLNVHNKKYCNKVITSKETIRVVKERFSMLQENDIEEYNLDVVRGNSTFKNGKVIVGECVVIKDNHMNISDFNLKDKILVCEVTTAKDVKYIKDVKALIVNSGGVLCHSAIFSREFNIPCLIGSLNATEFFNTGDVISYNVDEEFCSKGVVNIKT